MLEVKNPRHINVYRASMLALVSDTRGIDVMHLEAQMNIVVFFIDLLT